MPTKIILPFARIHQPLMVEIDIEHDVVTDSRSRGIMFRGFEMMLEGRDPRDATYLTQRICGICSSAHGVAATLAVEDAIKLEVTPTARIMRNLIFGADILQNHLRHFYLLTLQDYIRGPNIPPFQPQSQFDLRFSTSENEKLQSSYWRGVEMSGLAHKLLALYGGKAPHQHGIVVGGTSMVPDADRTVRFRGVLRTLQDFINQDMLPVMEAIAAKYNDYFKIGVAPENFLSYGMFPGKDGKTRKYPSGVYLDGTPAELDPGLITEDITYSYFQGPVQESPAEAVTEPDRNKSGANTWLKAPRYAQKAMEMGPLGRLWISGDYRNGTSTMDRLVARVLETKKVSEWMLEWLDQLIPGTATFTPFEIPESGRGIGLTEAMRGSLGHWVRIEHKKIKHYQIITPTAWQFSPKDAGGQRGPVDQSIVGTKIEDLEQFTEVGRIIRSYDPCFSCSGHLIEPGGNLKEFRIC